MRANRCSFGRWVTTRSRVPGSTSTEPISPTFTVTGEGSSVSIHWPRCATLQYNRPSNTIAAAAGNAHRQGGTRAGPGTRFWSSAASIDGQMESGAFTRGRCSSIFLPNSACSRSDIQPLQPLRKHFVPAAQPGRYRPHGTMERARHLLIGEILEIAQQDGDAEFRGKSRHGCPNRAGQRGGG